MCTIARFFDAVYDEVTGKFREVEAVAVAAGYMMPWICKKTTDGGKLISSPYYTLRSQTIERVFADAKEKHGMRYTPIKGLTRVRNWVRLKFAAMNLKKLAMWA